MDATTLARINLFAVLRTLEQLPSLDAECADIVNSHAEVIQFQGRGVGAARLSLGSDGISHAAGGGAASIKLWFPNARAVNAMFAGTGKPIPLKGLSKISFLTGPFTRITDILTDYLRPTPEALASPDVASANALLTLHLAAYAVAEIGNFDPLGSLNARRIADGNVVLAVQGGPALTLTSRSGRLHVTKGLPEHHRALMLFEDIDVAGQVLRNELPAYTAIGRDQIQLSGSIPMLDNINKILGLVPSYLA